MIEHIEVDGFRLLSEFKADFRSLNVVIGANATGVSPRHRTQVPQIQRAAGLR